MRVIFLKEILPHTKRGQVKNVAAGYARNYLFPNKLAILYTKQAEQGLLELSKKQLEKEKNKHQIQEQFSRRLDNQLIKFKVKASEDGILYGSINKKEIVEKIREWYKIELEERVVELEKPLKSIGQHKVRLRFSPTLKGVLVVEIIKGEA